MTSPTAQETFALALQHHQAGRLPEAERLYRLILAHDPRHAGAIHHLGVMAHQVGRNDVAVDLIRRLVALSPDDAEARYNLGVVLSDRGNSTRPSPPIARPSPSTPTTPKPTAISAMP